MTIMTKKHQTIFNPQSLSVISNSRLGEADGLPTFEGSDIFFLEILGEGGCAQVRKAYNKKRNEFVAIKEIKMEAKTVEENVKLLHDIIVEDDLLKRIEEIRSSASEYNQYFLKYDGVFKDPNKKNGLILEMETGCATLENILEAGKVFSGAELSYVIRKLAEGFAILEENGIANRDVKPQNIILVEDTQSKSEGKYFYKISDFGIGCILPKNTCLIPYSSVTGYSKAYASPEVMRFLENDITEEKYNPFLADVYSLGLIALKMINKLWRKKKLKNGLLLQKEEFQNYEPIFELIKGMLNEDWEKRWNFQDILGFYEKNEADFGNREKIPNDNGDYVHKWQVEVKERPKEKFQADLEILYQEHWNLFESYNERLTRPNEAKFHLDRTMEIVGLMKKNEYNFGVMKKEIQCKVGLGKWYQNMGNLVKAEKEMVESLLFLEKWCNSCENKESETEILKQYESWVIANLAIVYKNMGNLQKAEEFYMKSLTIRQKLFGENHANVANSFNNLGDLYENMGNLQKAEEFYSKSITIRQKLFGENHADVAQSFNNLGVLYEKMGNLQKAEEFYSKSLTIRQKLFGENHPDTLSSLDLLAVFYTKIGNVLKANELKLKKMHIRQTYFNQNNDNLFEKLSFNFGSICNNCNLDLKEYSPQYYCYFCDIYFCPKCGDKIDISKNGSHSLIHPHNMIWIDVKTRTGMLNIEKYKMGSNKIFDDNLKNFQANCDGCGGKMGNSRWVCLSCRPGQYLGGGYIDLCENCMKIIKNKETGPAMEALRETLKYENHDNDSHIYLRILFASQGKY